DPHLSSLRLLVVICFSFFFNDPAPTEIYTLSLPRRSSDLAAKHWRGGRADVMGYGAPFGHPTLRAAIAAHLRANRGIACEDAQRSEEHTSELQSLAYLVCRLLLEKKKNNTFPNAAPLELLS